MSFEEKLTWVNALVTGVVSAVYFTTVLGQVGEVPVGEIPYQGLLLVAVGASVVMTIIGVIILAIISSIAAEIRQEGSGSDIDRKDERDVTINRRGDIVGYYVLSAAVVGALGLAMLEFEHFWIANAIYASFVLGALVSSAVKIVAYRRGF